MRFVPVDGTTVRELERLTRSTDKEMRTRLTRLGKWWGYIIVEPDASVSPSSHSDLDWMVRPSRGGLKALETWQPLTGIIEKTLARAVRHGRHRSPSAIVAGAGC
jgi:hypothetical protein